MNRVPELGQIIATRHHVDRVIVGIITKLHNEQFFDVLWEPWAVSSYTRRYPFRSFRSFAVRGDIDAEVVP